MRGEFKGDPSGGPDTFSNPFRQLEVMAVAWRQVGPGLCYSDYWFTRHQFFPGDTIVEVPLNVEGHHARIALAVEPVGRP